MNQNKKIQHWHIINFFLVFYDLVVVNLSYLLVLWLRFDCRYTLIPDSYINAFLCNAPIHTVVCMATFVILRLYKSIWRFAGFSELIRVFFASSITSVIHAVSITLLFMKMPISYYIFGSFLQFFLVLVVRFLYRFVLLERQRRSGNSRVINVMVIGAGSVGQMIIRDLKKPREDMYKICCIIDDNKNKWGRYVEGIPVVGGREDIMVNVDKYHIDQILMTIPHARMVDRWEILHICKETNCDLKIIPSTLQIMQSNVVYTNMKDVDVEDLLGRDEIKTNNKEIFEFIKGKKVLVTGGGGSIGSELCRQIATHRPAHLIIFDIYENNAYEIEQELKRKFSGLNLTVLIGSVRDTNRINGVFEEYKPDIVYHAAAHKHVPLMEESPCEAIKNNVVGTYKTAYAALKNGCSRFVFISTDKAVNPTSIMGASKRICEMIIQSLDKASKHGKIDSLPLLSAHPVSMQSENALGKYEAAVTSFDPFDNPIVGRNGQVKTVTEFVAVRFGNVLGSNGSVIPLFKKQMEEGGPITVTHPDIIRYFMTIPEAVSLVLQAGVYAKGGEIFVFDMGAPVKIDTLARNLIKLSGYKPDEDIPIIYTGLRPGEKLYEETLFDGESMEKTANELIHIEKPIPFDMEQFFDQLENLVKASYTNDKNIKKLVWDIVPQYKGTA